MNLYSETFCATFPSPAIIVKRMAATELLDNKITETKNTKASNTLKNLPNVTPPIFIQYSLICKFCQSYIMMEEANRDLLPLALRLVLDNIRKGLYNDSGRKKRELAKNLLFEISCFCEVKSAACYTFWRSPNSRVI